MTDSIEKPARAQTPYHDLTLIEDRGEYAILTLNRPEKRNAMSRDAIARFREALVAVRGKRAVILTGTGSAFCAGMDLAEAIDDAKTERTSQELAVWTTVQAEIRAHNAVFIAAVNGYALGGGSTLINSCDLAIAAESAKIGAPEMGFGGFPSQAGPAAAKRLSPKHAAEFILFAQRLSAEDAFRMGMVNKVVPDGELLDEAIAWAERLAGFNPIALDWGKKTLQRMETLSWDDAMDYTSITNKVMSAKSTVVVDTLAGFVQGKRGVGQGA